MSEEQSQEQLKREAAAKAKEAALKKLALKKAQEQAIPVESQEADMAKQKIDTEAVTSEKFAEKSEKVENNSLILPQESSSESSVDDNAKQKAAEEAPTESAQEDEKAKAIAAAKAKAAAAAKAKAAALAKQKAAEEAPTESTQEDEKAKAIAAAKAKAVAAAKAKAAALAKQQTTEETPTESTQEDEKAKAIAAAKAKAAAAAKAKMAGSGEASGDDEKAKAIAAAKAKAAAAAQAKAKASGGTDVGEKAPELEQSPNQRFLDKYVKVIEEHLGKDVLVDSYLNKISKDVPTLVAKPDTYFKIAQFLKYNEQLSFDYLFDIHGSDFETHMEIYAHFFSFKNRQTVALKVKIDRDKPEIASIQPLWEGANWAEREAYDLLGITFKGHPNLKRILLPDNWVGHPLRKDYVQYDEEV